ncbi:MAG: glycerate kinase, partial [Hyphomicrobiales bacterium]
AVPSSVTAALSSDANETPDPSSPHFAHTRFELVARPAQALEAAAREAERLGYRPQVLGDSIEGEARDVAREHAELAIKTL